MPTIDFLVTFHDARTGLRKGVVYGVNGGGDAVRTMRFGLMYAWRIFEIFGYGAAFLEASIFLFGW